MQLAPSLNILSLLALGATTLTVHASLLSPTVTLYRTVSATATTTVTVTAPCPASSTSRNEDHGTLDKAICGTGTKPNKENTQCIYDPESNGVANGPVMCTMNYVPPPGAPAFCPGNPCGQGTKCAYDPRVCHYVGKCIDSHRPGKLYGGRTNLFDGGVLQ